MSAPKAKPIDQSGAWELTDHACRFCLARVIRNGDRYQCSTCGVETKGAPTGICGCGMHLGPIPKTERQIAAQKLRRPQAFQCILNPDPSPLNPAIVLVGHAIEPGAVVVMPDIKRG